MADAEDWFEAAWAELLSLPAPRLAQRKRPSTRLAAPLAASLAALVLAASLASQGPVGRPLSAGVVHSAAAGLAPRVQGARLPANAAFQDLAAAPSPGAPGHLRWPMPKVGLRVAGEGPVAGYEEGSRLILRLPASWGSVRLEGSFGTLIPAARQRRLWLFVLPPGAGGLFLLQYRIGRGSGAVPLWVVHG
jgi:hypothetical protein